MYYFGRARRAERVAVAMFRAAAHAWFKEQLVLQAFRVPQNTRVYKNGLVVFACSLLAIGCQDIHPVRDAHNEDAAKVVAQQSAVSNVEARQIARAKETRVRDRSASSQGRAETPDLLPSHALSDEIEPDTYQQPTTEELAQAKADRALVEKNVSFFANAGDEDVIVRKTFTRLPMPKQRDLLEALGRLRGMFVMVRLEGYENNDEMAIASLTEQGVIWSRWYALSHAWRP